MNFPRQLIRDLTDWPVTCGHELTSKPTRRAGPDLRPERAAHPQLQQLIRAVDGLPQRAQDPRR